MSLISFNDRVDENKYMTQYVIQISLQCHLKKKTVVLLAYRITVPLNRFEFLRQGRNTAEIPASHCKPLHGPTWDALSVFLLQGQSAPMSPASLCSSGRASGVPGTCHHILTPACLLSLCDFEAVVTPPAPFLFVFISQSY